MRLQSVVGASSVAVRPGEAERASCLEGSCTWFNASPSLSWHSSWFFNKGHPHFPFAPSPTNYAASSVCSEEIQRDNMYISRKLNAIVNQGDKNGIIKTCQFLFIKLAKWEQFRQRDSKVNILETLGGLLNGLSILIHSFPTHGVGWKQISVFPPTSRHHLPKAQPRGLWPNKEALVYFTHILLSVDTAFFLRTPLSCQEGASPPPGLITWDPTLGQAPVTLTS